MPTIPIQMPEYPEPTASFEDTVQRKFSAIPEKDWSIEKSAEAVNSAWREVNPGWDELTYEIEEGC